MTARDLGRKAGGLVLVLLGTLMIVTPGPGILVILVGLRLIGLGGG